MRLPERLVTYLEDAALVVAVFLILETVALELGVPTAAWVILVGCVAGLIAMRLRRP